MIIMFTSPIKAWEQMGSLREEATRAEIIAWEQFAAGDEDWAEYEIVDSYSYITHKIQIYYFVLPLTLNLNH